MFDDATKLRPCQVCAEMHTVGHPLKGRALLSVAIIGWVLCVGKRHADAHSAEQSDAKRAVGGVCHALHEPDSQQLARDRGNDYRAISEGA